MKTWILATAVLIGTGTLTGLIIHWKPSSANTRPNAELRGNDPSTVVAEPSPTLEKKSDERLLPADATTAVSSAASPAPDFQAVAAQAPSPAPQLKRAVECLASAQATYLQRQQAMTELARTGNLDTAITDLEHRMIDDPQAARYPAVLGQLYLQKCAAIQDMREQGILAMKADQVFDTALGLDPENWEARFTKAVAMLYWPPQMNKSEEMIGHFLTLIDQQEKQSSQPQFAATYVWLGDQYQKLGKPDYARQVWQRGGGLFPDNQELQGKLSASR